MSSEAILEIREGTVEAGALAVSGMPPSISVLPPSLRGTLQQPLPNGVAGLAQVARHMGSQVKRSHGREDPSHNAPGKGKWDEYWTQEPFGHR